MKRDESMSERNAAGIISPRESHCDRKFQRMAKKVKVQTAPTTIDEYLATVSDEQRALLTRLRKTIQAAAPKAEECISYGIPAFRQNGPLVGFSASKAH